MLKEPTHATVPSKKKFEYFPIIFNSTRTHICVASRCPKAPKTLSDLRAEIQGLADMYR
jgi:hypothetical protein